jgi:hypothetical protein
MSSLNVHCPHETPHSDDVVEPTFDRKSPVCMPCHVMSRKQPFLRVMIEYPITFVGREYSQSVV